MENNQEQLSEMPIEDVSNEVLANVVSESIEYQFAQFILVKPLEAEMVLKSLTLPVATEEKDEDGNAIMEMVATDKEVESNFRKGIVIAMPTSLEATGFKVSGMDVKIGDTIVFPSKRFTDFDLFKDAALVAPYEVVAKVK